MGPRTYIYRSQLITLISYGKSCIRSYCLICYISPHVGHPYLQSLSFAWTEIQSWFLWVPFIPKETFLSFFLFSFFYFFIFWQQTFCFLLVGLRIHTFKVFLLFYFFSQYAFQFQQSFFTKFVRSVRDHLICIKLLF